MRLIRPQAADIEGHLAIDDALLEAGEEVLRLWECEATVVVLGRSGRTSELANVAACAADRIPIVRRSSGGGAVVLSKGCLNYSFVFDLRQRPSWLNVSQSLRDICSRVGDAIGARFEEPCDLALNDRKVSGCAQRRTPTALLHHGTLLYNFDAGLAERYLREPRRQPAYRRGRSHIEFLGNLPLSVSELRTRMLRTDFRSYGVEKRYTVVDWNFAPGFRTTEGKPGLFGESGKCCVSKQNP